MVSSYAPKTLQEALKIRANGAQIFAGGTDLMVEHFIGSNTIIKFEKPVVHISLIDELKGVAKVGEKIIIGAATPFFDVINSKYTPQVLKEAASGIAGPPIRNSATIGGNICNASPSADSLPALYALNAVLVLQSVKEKREIPLKDFIVGVGKTIIADDEILTHIVLPLKNYEYTYYRKIGTRKANALSKLAFCGIVVKEGEKYRFRLTFCTLGITITRDEAIETQFITAHPQNWKNQISEIQAEYDKIMKPRNSARSTALYRKKTALNLIKYFFENVK